MADNGYDLAGAGGVFSRVGGAAYVDQKCLPQCGHTQNWSGFHGSPGAGSRNSICSPHRWHLMRTSISGMNEF